MTEIVAAHLERVAQLEQLSTLDVPDHNGHMVQWVRKKEVRPILAAALAACARESEKPLIEALTAVEELVADDFCHDLSMRKVRGEKKLMAEKLAAIYRVAHACNPEHSCHHVHDDWRKEAHALAAPAIAEREANRSVVEKAGKDLLGTLSLERAVGEKAT